MQSLAVIKYSDILQNVLLCFMAGLVMPPLAALLLEAAKEAFRNCIIPTISQTTHAANRMLSVDYGKLCWHTAIRDLNVLSVLAWVGAAR